MTMVFGTDVSPGGPRAHGRGYWQWTVLGVGVTLVSEGDRCLRLSLPQEGATPAL